MTEDTQQVKMLKTLLAEARSERDQLRAALENLVEKLHVMERPVDACLGISGIHGFPYTGPNWSEEMAAALRALGRGGKG